MAPDCQVTVTADRLPGRISPFHYGQLFEYLCDLVPSLYGEKLDDPNFEGIVPCSAYFLPEADRPSRPWRLIGAVDRGSFDLETEKPYAGSCCARITIHGNDLEPIGVAQSGIAVRASTRYRFAISARCHGLTSGVTVRLTVSGRVLASHHFETVGSNWSRLMADLHTESNAADTQLEIVTQGPGTLWLDMISLTGTDTVNGWRPDVVAALRSLNPGMLRFGGTTIRKHFDWKESTVPRDQRASFRDAGGSTQPGNVGVDEFLDLCGSIGAEPLMCVRFSDRRPAEAAELVEYCNGKADTGWGARRASLGRPAPHGVHYWQIGNEIRGENYERGLPAFCQAMLAVDPSIHLLSSFPTAGVLAGASTYLSHACPHLYHGADLTRCDAELRDLEALIAHHVPQDQGSNVRVAITEWNASNPEWGPGRGELMTLDNALACARFHNLLHRHGELVEIACRSNLADSFCGGAIETNASQLYCRPVYYVQQLYSTLGGRLPLVCQTSATAPDISAALTEDHSALILHLVNDRNCEIRCQLDVSAILQDQEPGPSEGWRVADTRHAGSTEAKNSFDDPTRVSTTPIPVADTNPAFDVELPGLSVTAVRLHLNGVAP